MPPWIWMASRKVRSATSEQRPKENGRATSAGKAGMSKTVRSGGGRSSSPRARKMKAAAAQAEKSATWTAREGADCEDATMLDPTTATPDGAVKMRGGG